MKRLAAWRRYRRRLAALLAEHEAVGYEVSPPVYRHLQSVARGTKKGD